MRIGWIGVGNMGNPMAEHVLTAGHDFKVHDLRQEAAANLLESRAKWAASLAKAADGGRQRARLPERHCSAQGRLAACRRAPRGRGLRHSVAIPL